MKAGFRMLAQTHMDSLRVGHFSFSFITSTDDRVGLLLLDLEDWILAAEGQDHEPNVELSVRLAISQIPR